MYKVLVDGTNAKLNNDLCDPYWKNNVFRTFEEAQEYAHRWYTSSLFNHKTFNNIVEELIKNDPFILGVEKYIAKSDVRMVIIEY